MQSPEARGLLESWGYHLDFGPDVPGGAVFAFLAALSAHVHGMPITEGGAGRITSALRTMIERAVRRQLGAREISVASLEDLILLKVVSPREKDLQDIRLVANGVPPDSGLDLLAGYRRGFGSGC